MDTTKTVTHLGLCAGYGGIELGLKRAIPSLRTIALCEIEAFAIANLVSKMEAGLMDPAPIWPDLKTFPWQSFRDRVDILTGGYPCQPFSAAGKRLGGEDPRHLWPHISRGISILQPRVCFFENVEGHITCGLHHVLRDLGRLGYRTTWGIFSASECGAPHQRKRVFIMAYSQRQRIEELSRWIANGSKEYTAGDHGSHAWPSRPGERQYGWEPPRVVADTKLATGPTEIDQRQKPIDQDGADLRDEYSTSSSAMADSHRVDRSAPAAGRQRDRQAGSAGEELGNAESSRAYGAAAPMAGEEHQEEGREPQAGNIGQATWNDGDGAAGEELGDTGCERQEERQVEAGGSEQSDEDLADTISGWRQQAGSQCGSGEVAADSGCKEGTGDQQAVIPDNQSSNGVIRQTQPPLGGDPDGPTSGLDYAELCVTCDNRTDELRLLGNGVVPATATRAFVTLINETN